MSLIRMLFSLNINVVNLSKHNAVTNIHLGTHQGFSSTGSAPEGSARPRDLRPGTLMQNEAQLPLPEPR